jgi:hypothetical protein
MRVLSCLVVAACLSAGAANAEVVENSETGFRTKKTVEVAASPDKAYAALGQIGSWWDNAHTYTGKASNMTLKLEAGACFCEALPGGGVRHGVVALAWPAQHTLRLDAALGPLQDEGAAGALTFKITPKTGGGSTVTVTYHVGGMRPAAAKTFAAPVDQVIGTQAARFARFVDTGKPD